MRQSPFNPISSRLIAPFYASPYINGRQTFPQIFVSTGLETLCGQTLDLGGSFVNYEVTQSVLVKNTGIDTLTIFSIAFVGDGDGFSIEPPELPFTLEPDQTLTLDILFLAASPGVHTGTLVITCDSISSPVCSIDITSEANPGSPGLAISSDTYLGDFHWCGFFPYTNSYGVPSGAELSNDSYVPYFPLRKTWEGEIELLTYNPFFDLSNPFAHLDGKVRHFVGTGGPGEILIDDATCTPSGTLLMSNEIGIANTATRICAGLSFAHFGGIVPYDASSTVGLFEMIQNNYTAWASVEEAGMRKTFWGHVRNLSAGVPGAGSQTPYGGSPCGEALLGRGSVTEVLDSFMTLQNAARNGGAIQIADSYRSQITSYTQSGKDMSGEATVLHLTGSTPSASGTMLATLFFNKTPTAGGPTEEISIDIEQEVGIGGTMDTYAFVPMMAGFTITLESSTVIDVIEFMDSFEDQTVGRVFIGTEPGYLPARRWPDTNPYFAASPGEQTIYCFANWDDMPVNPGYVDDSSGGYWAATGRFSALDGAACYDDFEDQSSPQQITSLSRGLGWAGPGVIQLVTYSEFRDDWDGIVAGSGITLPTYPTVDAVIIAISFQWWSFDGVFQSPYFGPQLVFEQYTGFSLADYTFIYDTFESYSTGPIVSLAGGSGFASAGYFA